MLESDMKRGMSNEKITNDVSNKYLMRTSHVENLYRSTGLDMSAGISAVFCVNC